VASSALLWQIFFRPRAAALGKTANCQTLVSLTLARGEVPLFLGNLDAKRDWAHARDYVEAMWRILQQPEPDDYVLATGETHSVREFVEKAFAQVGIRIEWQGRGVDEKGINGVSGEILVEIDPRYFRPTEVDVLIGDASKARSRLGWHHKVSFDELVSEMVAADLEAVAGESSRLASK
jgi:GDPmannose 4,6-dehydratase